MAKQRKTEKTKRQEKMHVKQDYPYYAKEESNKKKEYKGQKSKPKRELLGIYINRSIREGRGYFESVYAILM